VPRRLSRIRASAIACCIAAAGVSVAESPQVHTKLAAAQRSAYANLASPEGPSFQAACATAFLAGKTESSTRCFQESVHTTRGEPTSVSTYIRLSVEGTAQEVLTSPSTRAAKCWEEQAAATSFPKPPRDAYWVVLRTSVGQ